MATEVAANSEPAPAGENIRFFAPYYPIVYVRGYAMTQSEREQVFHDSYYGFAVTSVEKRQAPPPRYFEADIFEGLLIRLMKDHGYVDAFNRGLRGKNVDPARSLWVSRFYDVDFFNESARSIEEHANDLYELVCETIPTRLGKAGVDLSTYKVILMAHSMGGLVCRAFMQRLLPQQGKDPKDWVHRFVTMGSPHRGIDLGGIPDFLEDRVVTALNPFGAGIFKEERMRNYLDLKEAKGKTLGGSPDYIYDVHSLGPAERFPAKRCLCIVGSDWQSYGVVRKATGAFSDGLVKQDRAYVVSGPRPPSDPPKYGEDEVAFSANVHRAHSGHRGIVNSYESYENIQRFLFGDTLVRLDLDEIEIPTAPKAGTTYFHDLNFALAIRGAGAFLHRREQTPCENAMRIQPDSRGQRPRTLHLHTGFMDSKLRDDNEPYSRFLLRFRVTEHRVEEGLLWDREYPGRMIYSEDMEVRVGADGVDYRWLSEVGDSADRGWTAAKAVDGEFRFPLRRANSFAAVLRGRYSRWPNDELTKDSHPPGSGSPANSFPRAAAPG